MVKDSDTIKFLGLTLDKELNMTKFIAAKARTAHFNIETIKRNRKYLTEDETKMLMCSIVLSHLDYGNATPVNLPKSTLKPQSIQNYAAKVKCKSGNMTDLLTAYQHFTDSQYNANSLLELLIH